MPLQLQMLPAEMLPLNRNEALPGGNVIRQGIEFDRIGRRMWERWMDTVVLVGALPLPGYERDRRAYLACSWLPQGLGRSAEGCQGRDRADIVRPEEPHPGDGRARLLIPMKPPGHSEIMAPGIPT